MKVLHLIPSSWKLRVEESQGDQSSKMGEMLHFGHEWVQNVDYRKNPSDPKDKRPITVSSIHDVIVSLPED